MHLPPGDLFLLDRALPQPETREFLRLNLDGGQGTEVLFTRQQLAQNYADALPGQGWEITAMTRQDALVFLVESYARGFTSAAIDPGPGEQVQPVHIFRILVDSGEDGI
jgi:hypothetical protein